MTVVFSLDKLAVKFWWNKSRYCTCEDKSCPYCVLMKNFQSTTKDSKIQTSKW